MRRSPLHAEHEALGAHTTEFAGWAMPLRYASQVAEHHAVRTAAGLFDLSHMGQIVVTGPAAGADLDRALVGLVSTLAEGRARYTMACAEDGGVLDDLIVYRTGPEEFLVVANAANHEVVASALTEHCAPGSVTEAEDPALIAVQGPAAAAIVAELVDDDPAVAGLRNYAATATTAAGVPALAARTGYTGEDGFELFVPGERAAHVWRAALAAGAGRGLVPAGLAARDTLRLEAGMPLYGHELDRTTTPYEAGLGRVVRLDKTDAAGAPLEFVGRGPLAALSTATPARVLVGLAVVGRRPARPGNPVLTPAGAEVGAVTSGAPSPTLGHPVAMAYVTPEVSAPGTHLVVDVRGHHEEVDVVGLPFYRRSQAG